LPSSSCHLQACHLQGAIFSRVFIFRSKIVILRSEGPALFRDAASRSGHIVPHAGFRPEIAVNVMRLAGGPLKPGFGLSGDALSGPHYHASHGKVVIWLLDHEVAKNCKTN
jgi:hypothetical protein